MVSIKEQNQLL